MIEWYWLFLPAVTGLLNRFWRGEAGVPRWVWYALMTALPGAIMEISSGNMHGVQKLEWTASWLVFFLGYALAPWQIMFSAVNGQPPGRRDGLWIRWLGDLSAYLLGIKKMCFYTASTWRKLGVVYGTLRAAFMIPGIIFHVHLSGSYVPLVGLFGLGMGLVYYGGYRLARHFNIPIAMGVPFAEFAMGWWLGTYILIVGAVA